MAKAFEDNVYKMTTKESPLEIGGVLANKPAVIKVRSFSVNKTLVVAVDDDTTTFVGAHRNTVVHRIFTKPVAKNWMNRRLEEFVNDLAVTASPKKKAA